MNPMTFWRNFLQRASSQQSFSQKSSQGTSNTQKRAFKHDRVEQIQRALENASKEALPPSEVVETLNWPQWYEIFKTVATAGNPSLQLPNSRENIIDFMDHKPLKDAFVRGADATVLGIHFATHFDVPLFLRDNGIFD